ncbi:MAG: hypothetical protein J5792_01290 [Bacteroidales bacterium]|nr:hypothetical protein [Bacteroidales bacterium]
MKKVSLKTIESHETVGLYSIFFEGADKTEFERFLEKFREESTLNKDFQTILLALSKIIKRGALERFFRIEGKINDDLCALSLDSKKLRLYCLRISDQILILGNGGVKETRTYQEDETLSGYVMDLQKFDRLLKAAQKNGKIVIEKNCIIGLEEATFNL